MDSKTNMENVDHFFENLKQIAEFIPAPLYWLDTNGIVLGFNAAMDDPHGDLESVRDKVMGKRHEDFYPEHFA